MPDRWVVGSLSNAVSCVGYFAHVIVAAAHARRSDNARNAQSISRNAKSLSKHACTWGRVCCRMFQRGAANAQCAANTLYRLNRVFAHEERDAILFQLQFLTLNGARQKVVDSLARICFCHVTCEGVSLRALVYLLCTGAEAFHHGAFISASLRAPPHSSLRTRSATRRVRQATSILAMAGIFGSCVCWMCFFTHLLRTHIDAHAGAKQPDDSH